MTTSNSSNSFVEDRCLRKLGKSISHSVEVGWLRKGDGSMEIVPNELCHLVYDPVNGGFGHTENSRHHTIGKSMGKLIDIDQDFQFIAIPIYLHYTFHSQCRLVTFTIIIINAKEL